VGDFRLTRRRSGQSSERGLEETLFHAGDVEAAMRPPAAIGDYRLAVSMRRAMHLPRTSFIPRSSDAAVQRCFLDRF